MTEALEDLKETPEEMALNYKCAMFKTPEDVLKGARHMVCISCLYLVQLHFKGFFIYLYFADLRLQWRSALSHV